MRFKYLALAFSPIFMYFGIFILIPAIYAVFSKSYESILPFCVSASISILIGFLFKLLSGIDKTKVDNLNTLKKNEGLCIVVVSWVLAGLLCSIPYLFYGINPINSLFEGVSGITTTGATILTHFNYPKPLFLWRSLSQWLGGAGIIVLFIAILPQFAVAGRKLFFAEMPGPTEEKITPRIKNTAMALWKIYIGLTILEIILLIWCKMPVFDAVCNSFSTISCGGFSPNAQSILGYHSDKITLIIIAFIFFAGANFNLQYLAITKFKPQTLFKSEEFKTYFWIFLGISILVGISLFLKDNMNPTESMINSAFQVISLMTSTGFVSSDYASWDYVTKVILFITLFTGGCACSASGGIKISRWIIIFKSMKNELTKILHPNAVVSIKLDRTIVSKEILGQLLTFLFFYFFIAGVSIIIISVLEHNTVIGITSAVSAIGNIGPAFGNVIGPMGNFDSLTSLTKLILIMNMFIGRLELIPFLVLFQRDFWK